MSMHKQPLTMLEAAGLKRHGLPVGKPSQLADSFRQGMAYAVSVLEPADNQGPSPMTDAWLLAAMQRAVFVCGNGSGEDRELANVLRGFANRVLLSYGTPERAEAATATPYNDR